MKALKKFLFFVSKVAITYLCSLKTDTIAENAYMKGKALFLQHIKDGLNNK